MDKCPQCGETETYMGNMKRFEGIAFGGIRYPKYSNHNEEHTLKNTHFCEIHGDLQEKIQSYCKEHVEKEWTGVPEPQEHNSVQESFKIMQTESYPPSKPKLRRYILDAMKSKGLHYIVVDGENCLSCKYELVKTRGFGSCSKHKIALLGYDDGLSVCDHYVHKFVSAGNCNSCLYIDKNGHQNSFCAKTKITILNCAEYTCNDYEPLHGFHKGRKIIYSAYLFENGPTVTKLKDDYYLHVESRTNSECKSNDINIHIYKKGLSVFRIEEYLLQSISFNSEINAFEVDYIGETKHYNKHGKLIDHPSENDNIKSSWVESLSEDLYFAEVELVKREQVNHGVYSGDKGQNCEKCYFVIRNSNYPDGSPTGLFCKMKQIRVTSNARCNDYMSYSKGRSYEL